jgi:uncharacterized protein DUF6077
MIAEAKVTLLVAVWLALAVLVGIGLVVLSRRGRRPIAKPVVLPGPALARGRPERLVAATLAAGFVSAVLAGAHAPWAFVWIVAFLAVALTVALGRLRWQEPAGTESSTGWPAHVFATLVGLGFAAMSLFINRPNQDDAFYVNRATATAELNRIPVRDVLFTDEKVPPTSAAGLPVDTFSALEGAVGRFLDVHGASVAYYGMPPLMTFLATWALWRLLRSWAPRQALLSFALGAVYLLFSAQLPLTAGSYFLTRIWQGKVVFVAWLVPTVYTYATRWLDQREGLTAVLLLAAGISTIGLTASSAFVAPLLFGAAALPLLARRDWRGLPVLVGAAAFPFLVGLVVAEKYPLSERFVGGLQHTSWYFESVFGLGGLGALGMIALLAVPWLARAGPAAALATSIAVVSVLLLAPGVLPALSDLAGVSNALRRSLWIIPFPAVVGLLAAVPAGLLTRRLTPRPALRRVAVAAPAVVIAAGLIVFGDPLWSSRVEHSVWVGRPTWKVNQDALADARGILARYRGSGPVLAPEPIMTAIAIATVDPKAVNARRWYATLTPEPPRRIRDRIVLANFVASDRGRPPRERVRRALSNLRVGLVCVQSSRRPLVREVELAGRYREAFRVHGLVCLRRE